MRNSPNEPDDPGVSPEDERLLGFHEEDSRWMRRVAQALEPGSYGKLGSYEIVEEIDRGGQGVVYRARQTGTGRDVALKRLLAGSFASDAARVRFQREVEVLASLRHPGIVTVHEVQEVEGLPVLAMEWVDGVSITEWMRGVPRESASDADLDKSLRVFIQVGEAVHHAHQNGVLHRDLKPSNILVEENGRVCVLDFGLAKTLLPEADNSDLTRSNEFFGTLAYASPEQLRGGSGGLDVRSDVYSLGVILYEILTGKRPYEADGPGDLLEAMEREDFQPPSRLRGDVARDLDAVLGKALASRREDRYASVSGLIEDLERYLAHEPVSAHPRSAWYELRKLIRRNRPAALLSALLLASLIGFGAHSRFQSEVIASERDAEAAARADAQSAELVAKSEAERSELMLDYFLTDVFRSLEPDCSYEELSVKDFLQHAGEQAHTRFAERPEIEVQILASIGDLFRKNGRFMEAEEAYRACLARLDEAPGSVDWREAHLRLGQSLVAQGDFHEGLAFLEEARQSHEDAGAEESSRLILVRAAMVGAYMGLMEWEAAQAQASANLALLGETEPDNEVEILEALKGIGVCQAQLGDLKAARETYDHVLERAAAYFGDQSTWVADCLAFLAEIDRSEGKLADAKEKLRISLELTSLAHPPDHPDVASAQADLAKLMLAPEELPEGEQLLRGAIEISVATRGEAGFITRLYQLRLGENLCFQGRWLEALEFLEPAVTHFEEARGNLDPRTRKSRVLLARAYQTNEMFPEAAGQWERLFESYRELKLIPQSTKNHRQSYFKLLASWGRGVEDFDALDRFVEAGIAASPNSRQVLAGEAAAWYRGRSGEHEQEALHRAVAWEAERDLDSR